jgi:hypothetical protein
MQYSIFRSPIYSFFSRDFYVGTARTGRGTGFLYLFMILLISYPLSVAGGYFHFVALLDSPQVNEIMAKLPDLTVRQGTLSINKTCPYKMEFKNASTGQDTLIVFDTSGKTTSTQDARALITDKGILFEGDSEIIPWSRISSNFDFPASRLKDSLKSVVMGIAAGALLLLPLVWGGHVLLALIYGAVGLVMDRNKMGFRTALRLSCLAMTPSIVLTTLFYVLFGKPDMVMILLLWELITVPLSLGYLLFGYNSLADSGSLPPPAPPAQT